MFQAMLDSGAFTAGNGSESRSDSVGHPLYCRRCGYSWVSVVDEPKRCPNCGSFQWAKPKRSFVCKVCGHTWVSRKDGEPNKCPSCKSVKWDVEPLLSDDCKGAGCAIPVHPAEEAQIRIPPEMDVDVSDVIRMAVDTSVPFFTIISMIKKSGGTISP